MIYKDVRMTTYIPEAVKIEIDDVEVFGVTSDFLVRTRRGVRLGLQAWSNAIDHLLEKTGQVVNFKLDNGYFIEDPVTGEQVESSQYKFEARMVVKDFKWKLTTQSADAYFMFEFV